MSEFEDGRKAGLAEAVELLEREMAWWRDERKIREPGMDDVRGGISALLRRFMDLQNTLIYSHPKLYADMCQAGGIYDQNGQRLPVVDDPTPPALTQQRQFRLDRIH